VSLHKQPDSSSLEESPTEATPVPTSVADANRPSTQRLSFKNLAQSIAALLRLNEKLPVCTNGYTDLREFLLGDLKTFGQTSGQDTLGNPAITAKFITLGQIEYMAAQVHLCADMLKFSLFTTNRNSVAANFSNAKRLFEDLFAIISVSDPETVKMRSTEGLQLMTLRSAALEAIIVLCDLRANYRISLAVDAWERIFQQMESERQAVTRKPLYRRSESQSSFASADSSEDGDNLKATLLDKMFREFHGVIEELFRSSFASSIVCPDHIGADRVYDSYEGNKVLACLLGLSAYGNRVITENVLCLVFRQASQHVRFSRDLSLVKILVYEHSVAVFQQTNNAIRRFSAIQNGLNLDLADAYTEACQVLREMKVALTVSESNSSSEVSMNQKIFFDLKFHLVLVNILRLPLERAIRQQDDVCGAETVEPDKAVNVPRRILFQETCDLLNLMVKNNKRAQKLMIPHIPLLIEHVGIRDLNVVSCVRQMMEGNLKICSEVSEHMIQKLVYANVKYGRRARWLNILEIFLECQGKPIRRNQDLILRMLIDDKDLLIDFTCDYSEGKSNKNLQIAQALEMGDTRRGKTRQDLMIDKDHELKIRSLLKYHMTGLRLLGMCAAGKLNQAAKDECAHIPEISLQRCIQEFLDLDLKPGGSRETRIDQDVLFYVQRPYLRLITNVYLTNFDPKSFKTQAVQRWWPPESSERPTEPETRDRQQDSAGTQDLGTRQSVMGECVRILETLHQRLNSVTSEREEFATACFVDVDTLFADSYGCDLSLHVGIALQVLDALAAFFCREDAYLRYAHPRHDALVQRLADLLPGLCENFIRFHSEPHAQAVVELKYALEKHQFHVGALSLEKADENSPPEDSPEQMFLNGWDNFIAHLAIQLRVDPNPEKSMLRSVRDLALVFGSRKTLGNGNLEHIKMLIDTASACSLDALNQLTALRVITATLYMQPNSKHLTADARDREFRHFLDNEDPSVTDTAAFAELQLDYSRLGAVQVVGVCVGVGVSVSVSVSLG